MGAQGILEKTLEGDESSRVVVADRSFNKIQFKLVFDIRKKVAVASFIFNRAEVGRAMGSLGAGKNGNEYITPKSRRVLLVVV